MAQLALFGGNPIRTKPFSYSISTGSEEVEAATAVIKTGLLSGFLGGPSAQFLGGTQVRKLEDAWAEKFNVKYAISCNSATSALMMAIGAMGIEPGDEVIVSPYTMSATATSILIYGGIPVFADIEADYFCLDPKSVESKITKRTKAIISVDIHGQSADVDAIQRIAKKYDLRLITDCAQAPGAKYQNQYAGTFGDIGIFSLNRHKAIQCGEGGIAVTNSKELCLRMQLIRNHGENLVEDPHFAPQSIVNILGFNFRMTEVEAAIAYEQLKKLDRLNHHRQELVSYLNSKMIQMDGITLPKVRENCTHVYYLQALLFDETKVGVSRDKFIAALRAEGIPLQGGYVRPLYLSRLYQEKIAIGSKGFPFTGSHYSGEISYEKGICPVAELLYEKKSLMNPFIYPPLSFSDMDDILQGLNKVLENASRLNEKMER